MYLKNIIGLNLFLICCSVNSQIIKEFPVDENGKISFSEVIPVEGENKDKLYSKAKEFFVVNFKSANNVIQMDDKENNIIIGKGNSQVLINAGLGVKAPLRMNFAIKIETKDGRYRYEIYNLSYDGGYGESGFEDWFLEKNYFKKNGKPKGIIEEYKNKILAEIEDIKSLIKSAMIGSVTAKKDW